MTGKSLHDFDLELCSSIRANLRHYRHDARFQKALTENLAGPLRAYVTDDEDAEPGPHERFLLSFEDLWDLQHFAAGCDGRLTWSVGPAELRRRSLYPIREIRAHLSAQNAEEWTAASARFADVLASENLALDDGIDTIADWVSEVRRLLRAMGGVALLPHPDGSFPTPSRPDPPPTLSPSEIPSAEQGQRGDATLAAAIAETQTLQREVRDLLVSQHAVKDYYTTEEAAHALGKAEFTVREWCRQKRIHAAKKGSGRGKYQSWVISHDELLRIRREGLLPIRRRG